MNDIISLSELHLEELWEMRESLSMKILLARVTIRHHAIDKTYQPGSLFPDQKLKFGGLGGKAAKEMQSSYKKREELFTEQRRKVDLKSLCGKAAKEMQSSYKKREELFTEQRRKVDLKTFGSWDESPENIMMDMIARRSLRLYRFKIVQMPYYTLAAQVY
nr:hypothetical protein CFP56_61327 [Quercus suber]